MLAFAQPEATAIGDRLTAIFDWEPAPIVDPGSKRSAILDFGFLTREGLDLLAAFPAKIGTRAPPPPALSLLPNNYRWVDSDTGQQRIPLPLCEFLAYKSALAYERPEIIKHNLENCCHGIEYFAFFDTNPETKEKNDKSVKKAKSEVDTQGYGFVYEDKAFIILRGSVSDIDWEGNFNDALTDIMNFVGDKTTLSQVNAKPLSRKDTTAAGCHLGFAIGWSAVAGQVEDWIASLPNGGRHPFVFGGHSLGGALACLGAFDFASKPKGRTVAAVVTFGAPRVGNAVFAKLYNERLEHQTVRVELTGDSVPDIMGRWYYPVLSAARQMVKQRTWRTAFPNYAPVGLTWEFPEAPPISRDAFLSAIQNIESQAAEKARKKKEEAEQRRKQETAEASGPASPEGTSKPPAGNQDKQNGRWIFWIIGGVFVLVIALCLWLFVRHKIASHGAAQRYAAYLSTLSYRRIRALSARNLTAANASLGTYLRFIRGDANVDEKLLDQLEIPNKPPTTFYSVITALPVALKDDDRFEVFLRESSNIC